MTLSAVIASMLFTLAWLGYDVEPLLDWLEAGEATAPLPQLRKRRASTSVSG